MSEDKKLNMPQSLLLLLLIIGAVAVCIRLKTGGPMIGLFMSWIIIYLFCKVLRINYEHVVNGAYDAIRVVVPTLDLSKTVIYSLFDREAVQVAQGIFKGTLSEKIFRQHKHDKDRSLGVSPHVCKCTRYNNQLYDMGKCQLRVLKKE